MTTGQQAQMYADHYIGFHMSAMPTYAAASGANRAAAGALAADPTNPELQAAAKQAAGTVETDHGPHVGSLGHAGRCPSASA
jgi:hypothetical protein